MFKFWWGSETVSQINCFLSKQMNYILGTFKSTDRVWYNSWDQLIGIFEFGTPPALWMANGQKQRCSKGTQKPKYNALQKVSDLRSGSSLEEISTDHLYFYLHWCLWTLDIHPYMFGNTSVFDNNASDTVL